MKPDYKNWMPKGMVYSFLFAALGCGVAAVVLRLLLRGTLGTALTVLFAAAAVACSAFADAAKADPKKDPRRTYSDKGWKLEWSDEFDGKGTAPDGRRRRKSDGTEANPPV